jgi:hypothetical protein
MKKPLHLLVIVLFLTTLIGCSSHCTTKDHDWTITVGSGGGFTGGSSGYTIEGSGKVRSWRTTSATAEKQMRDMPALEAHDAATLKSYLDAIHFDTITSRRPGNMTLFVELKQPNTTHRVNWSNESSIHELQSFYDFALTYLTSLGGSK